MHVRSSILTFFFFTHALIAFAETITLQPGERRRLPQGSYDFIECAKGGEIPRLVIECVAGKRKEIKVTWLGSNGSLEEKILAASASDSDKCPDYSKKVKTCVDRGDVIFYHCGYYGYQNEPASFSWDLSVSILDGKSLRMKYLSSSNDYGPSRGKFKTEAECIRRRDLAISLCGG